MGLDAMTPRLWDLPGQTNFRRLWRRYYRETHAVLFMVDSADTHRLSEAKNELQQILSESDLEGAPVLVLANKQDLSHAVDHHSMLETLRLIASPSFREDGDGDCDGEEEEKSMSSEEMKGYALRVKDRSLKVMCTCCLNKEGLSDAMSWLVYSIPAAQSRIERVQQFQIKDREQKKL